MEFGGKEHGFGSHNINTCHFLFLLTVPTTYVHDRTKSLFISFSKDISCHLQSPVFNYQLLWISLALNLTRKSLQYCRHCLAEQATNLQTFSVAQEGTNSLLQELSWYVLLSMSMCVDLYFVQSSPIFVHIHFLKNYSKLNIIMGQNKSQYGRLKQHH